MKFNKILSVFFGSALLFGGYACTDEVEYTPAAPETTNEVYFSNEAPAEVAIQTDANEVVINLNRVNDKEELTVNLESTVVGPDGNPITTLFSIPASVKFEAGKKVAPIVVTFNFADVVPEVNYTFDIKVVGEETTPYGMAERKFNVSYAPWSPFELYSKSELGIYYTFLWDGAYEDSLYVSKSLVNDKQEKYMMKDPFSDLEFEYRVALDKSISFDVEGDECYLAILDRIELPGDLIGSNQGNTVLYDIVGYNLTYNPNGLSAAEIVALLQQNGKQVSYYNPKTGLFTIVELVTSANIEAEGYYLSGIDYMQLPGYVDYSINFTQNGNLVDNNGVEYAVINAVKTEAVESYAYCIEEGALTREEALAIADEMKASEDLELVFDASKDLQFALADEGDYTIVAVGFNASGEAVCTENYTFAFESVQARKSLGYCVYVDGILNSMYANMGKVSMEVELWENKFVPGQYRILNPYADSKLIADEKAYFEKAENRGYIIINAQDPTAVYLEKSLMGIIDPEEGQIGAYSLAGYEMEVNGKTLAEVKAAGLTGKLEGNIITFPDKSLLSFFEGSTKYYTANQEAKKNAFGKVVYGPGTFKIDMSNIFEAPARKSMQPAIDFGAIEKAGEVAEGKTVKSGIRQGNYSSEEIRQYRFKNIQTFKF